MRNKFSSIPEPTTDPRSLQNSVLAIKEVVEALTGQRPNTFPPITANDLVGYATREQMNAALGRLDAATTNAFYADHSVQINSPAFLQTDVLGGTNLDSGRAYEVRLVTTGTGTITGSFYRIYNGGSGWQLITVHESVGSNRPYLRLDGNKAEVRTDHTSFYNIRGFVQFWEVGNNIDPDFFGP